LLGKKGETYPPSRLGNKKICNRGGRERKKCAEKKDKLKGKRGKKKTKTFKFRPSQKKKERRLKKGGQNNYQKRFFKSFIIKKKKAGEGFEGPCRKKKGQGRGWLGE